MSYYKECVGTMSPLTPLSGSVNTDINQLTLLVTGKAYKYSTPTVEACHLLKSAACILFGYLTKGHCNSFVILDDFKLIVKSC